MDRRIAPRLRLSMMHAAIFWELFFQGENTTDRVWVGLLEQDLPTAMDTCFLSPEEQKLYSRFRVDRRRHEFLAGRSIAKETIRVSRPWFAPEMINIVHGVWGFPLVHTHGLERSMVSISHTHQHAAALFFAANTHPLGIDIENITADNLPALERFVLKNELVVDGDQIPYLEALHILWSAKEALGKALRTGFTLPQQFYTVSSLHKFEEIHHICFEKFPQLHVVAWLYSGCCVTVAFPSTWKFINMTKRTMP